MCYEKSAGKNYEPKLIIEDDVIIGPFFTALVADTLTIGQGTIIAQNCLITTEKHGTEINGVYFYKQPLNTKKVTVGKNCWIGQNVCILPGVNIGDNVIIGAGAVVTKDIPSNSIAAGNPAKVLKKYNFSTQLWEKE